mgnify:FL=1
MKMRFQYDFATDNYHGLIGIYFNKVLRNVIEIGELNKKNDTVLDIGFKLKKLKR